MFTYNINFSSGFLSLQENEFTGVLSDEFRSLTKLEELLLFDNSFEGDMNHLLDGLPALSEFSIRSGVFIFWVLVTQSCFVVICFQ